MIASGRSTGAQWGWGVVREGVVDTEETPSVERSEGGAGGRWERKEAGGQRGSRRSAGRMITLGASRCWGALVCTAPGPSFRLTAARQGRSYLPPLHIWEDEDTEGQGGQGK